MIYYHPQLNKKLKELGITLPLEDQRAADLFLYLQQKLDLSAFLTPSLQCFSLNDLSSVHSGRYCEELLTNPTQAVKRCYAGYFNDLTKIGAVEIREKVLMQAYATYEAMKLALSCKYIYYLGGGMHHAMSDGGRGFCLINDIALSIRKLQQEQKISRVWIIDVDAHKGDGSAEIFEFDKCVKTFSIHMAKGWPLDGSEDSRVNIASSLDVPIAEGEDDRYLKLLEEKLNEFIRGEELPDLICIVAGMDVWKEDRLQSSAGINLERRVILERDKFLYSTFAKLKIPQLYLMAGGYGPEVWQLYADFIMWSFDLKSEFVS